MNKCEKCSKNGSYVAEVNRTLCHNHAEEFTAKHGLLSDSSKAMEHIVFDMTSKYKNQLSEQEINKILKGVSTRIFDSYYDY